MNMPSRRIVVTGFMGAGKTAVATALARRLDCRMIDLDEFIAVREGRSISSILDEDGEDQFRRIETIALMDALEVESVGIIALGGGTWTFERNRALFSGPGYFTVWLDTPFDLCWQRIKNEGNPRPLARDRSSAQQLYDARRSSYQLAKLHIIVDETSNIEDTVSRLEEALPK